MRGPGCLVPALLGVTSELDDRYLRPVPTGDELAVEGRLGSHDDKRVLVSINSDAHSVHEFDNLAHGIGQARRGWLEKGDVLNTRPLADLRRWLARRR